MTEQERKARHTLNRCTVKQLIDLWNETEKKTLSLDVSTVRGWIMDALEAKNPKAFEKWIMSDAIDSNDPTKYFAA